MRVPGSDRRGGDVLPFGPAVKFSGGGVCLALMCLFVLLPGVLEAQLASAAAARSMVRVAPRVHVECEVGVPCSQGILRDEVTWVDWLAEPAGADVHVLVSGMNGGEDPDAQRFNVNFAGQGAFAHLSDVLIFAAAPDEGATEVSAGIAQAIRMGLMRYAVEAGLGLDLALAFNPRLAAEFESGAAETIGAVSTTASTSSVYDPWNYWTFRVGLSGDIDIQESRQNYRVNPSINADRVTEAWKLNLSASHNVNRETIELTNRTVHNDQDSWNLSALVVRSLGAHTSTGLDFEARNSIQDNQRSRVTVAPGLEWNYYPYAESTRRQLLAHYAVGAQYSEYHEETIFGVMSQITPMHKIGIQYRQSESWGNAGVSLDGLHYLHDAGLYSLGASGNLSLRVIRGLDLNLSTSGSWIRDQIHIPAGNLSEEDILLGRQALPTGYHYQFSVGLAYRWGSAFSNIVNSRFPSVSGRGFGGGGGPPR